MTAVHAHKQLEAFLVAGNFLALVGRLAGWLADALWSHQCLPLTIK